MTTVRSLRRSWSRVRALSIALALVLVVVGCGARAEDERAPAYDDIQRIFDQSCAGATCHRSATAAPPTSIDLAPAVSYQTLVGRASTAAPARLLVAPGAPADSYLLCTIDPACDHRVGARMPPTGALSPSTVEAVRRWIAEGARADDSPAPPLDAGDDAAPVFGGLDTAIATGEHAIDLAWRPAFDQTPPSRLRYRVYVATTAGAQDFGAPRLTITAATSATLDGLEAGVRYHVVVRAVDEAGHEDANRIERATATPDVTPPEFGGVADVSEPSAGTLRVTWLEATDNASPAAAIGYHVYLATQPGAQSFAMPAATVTGVTATVIVGLAPSTTYHVVVRAFDEAGNQEHNLIERALTTADIVAPTFAGVATATGAPNAVVLTWAAATDDTTATAELVYLVYRANVAGGQDFTTPTYVTAPGATGFSAGGLLPNRTYHFVVRARDQAGNIDGNLIQRSATTPIVVDVQPPMFAGAATATALGAGAIRLTWSAGTDNVTLAGNLVYSIYRATTAGGQSFAAATYRTLPGTTTFVATGLAPSTTYFFVVRASDQAGNQDGNVVQVSATTTADTTAPVFAGITGAASASSSSIALAWSAASDDISPAATIVYDVYRATSAGGQAFAAPTYTSAPGANGLVATGLAPLTTYFFVVRARDQAGNRDPNTIERTAATSADIAPPVFAGAVSAAPTGLPGQLDITWAAASDAVTTPDHLRYLLYPATMSGLQELQAPAAITAPGATSFRLTGLMAATPYFVVVRARDEAGNIDGNLVEVVATTTADTVRPTFGGLSSATATNPSHVRLTWAAASDDVTAPALMIYDVYVATSAGAESFAAPTVSSPPGATSLSVGGLNPTTTYHFVVRARDQAGNRDLNTVERSATTPGITVSLATQVQPIFTASCATANCHRPPGPSIGLDLSTAAESRAGMVNVASSEFGQIVRVAPGDSEGSYLMAKLLGGGPNFEGDLMPPSGGLTAGQIATIRIWIEEGAVDN